MAGAVQLTEVDFEQIKLNLVNYLKSTNKFTDFDFDGSNLSVILNLIAYQAQLSAYSANMIANESFLSSSTIRRNVVRNAKQLGYVPQSSATAIVQADFGFNLNQIGPISDLYPGGLPNYVQIEPGLVFRAKSKDTSIALNVIDPQKSSVDSTGQVDFKDLDLYEGTLIKSTFTKDSTVFNQKFIIENQNVDITTLRIQVQESPNETETFTYTQSTNLTQLDETSRTYWVDEYDEGNWELTFGDGYFGTALQDGAKIYVSYLITKGSEASGTVNINTLSYSGRCVDSFGTKIQINPTVTSLGNVRDGSDPESVPSIKFRAPKNYAAQGRCVTADDYETIIRNIYPNIEDMFVFGGEEKDTPEYGRIYAVIKPVGSDTLSNLAIASIKNTLKSYKVASLDLVIKGPEILNIELSTVVYYDPKMTRKDDVAIKSDVMEAVTHLANSKVARKFGGSVKYSKIVGLIDDADDSIVRNTTDLIMMKKFGIAVSTLATYEVCFENSLTIDNNDSVIYSTGFKVDGDEKTYFFENIPQIGFERMGVIRRFYFNENNDKVVVDDSFGTVDYTIGEIILNPIAISETSIGDGIIEVRSIPIDSGMQVRASREVFFKLNLEGSIINVAKSLEVS